jgi:hypothetical protein
MDSAGTISLHAEDDYEYSQFIKSLIEELFEITPSLVQHKTRTALNIVISRISLVEFLVNECGLVYGNKVRQRVDVPFWIKENPEYFLHCVRGLIDTDGSVFTHRYMSKDKLYSYKKLSFTSKSNALLVSTTEVLTLLGIKSRIGSNFDVRIDSQADMKSYFDQVGSHNPKHLKRFAT